MFYVIWQYSVSSAPFLSWMKLGLACLLRRRLFINWHFKTGHIYLLVRDRCKVDMHTDTG